MAMTGGIGADGDTIADINTTPLIDVMLVLLVMLIITIPPVRHAVVLDTPQPQKNLDESPPPVELVRIGVDFDGVVSWNGETVQRAEWERRMNLEALRQPQPEIHIEPHRLAEYGAVAAVMASAQRSGLERMGVVGGT